MYTNRMHAARDSIDRILTECDDNLQKAEAELATANIDRNIFLLERDAARRELAGADKRIEQEVRTAAVEDCVKAVYAPWGDWRDLIPRFRALAPLPSTHVVVPVEHIKWLAKQDIPNDHACADCVPHTTLAVKGFQCTVHYARAMIAGRKQP